MERGTPFLHYQLPKSNSGMDLDKHKNNPNLTLTSNANMNNSTAPVQPQTNTIREQDQYMPIANVIRIMRGILPLHAKISDDAKETIQECVSEYISFVTGEANERCQREKRKTVTAEDIMYAMEKLGFDDYVRPLKLFINRYREFESDREYSVRGESSSFRPTYVGNGVGFNGSPYDPHHGPVQGPVHGPTSFPIHGPSHGPVQDPSHNQIHMPTHGPTHGPVQDPSHNQVHMPAHGPVHGPVHGPAYGPALNPAHGPVYGPTRGLVHGSTHGQIYAPSHGPTPLDLYDFGMLNQSMVMSGGRYYQKWPGQNGSGASGGYAHSMNRMVFFDQ